MHHPPQETQQSDRCRPITSTVSEIEEVIIPEESDKTTLLNSLSSTEPIRRRVPGKFPVDGGSRRICRQQSFGREIGHAAAETYLITGLSFKLLRYLGVGYRWITKLLALTCYAMLLMPGFLQVAYIYFFSPQVRRSVVYGDQPRNRLDLYLPSNNDGMKPVVVFVTGGAWIIGYNLYNLVDHFHNRGLYRSIFLSIMEGEESFEKFSPEVRLKDPIVGKAASLLPPIMLFHGSSDYSIPCDASKTFADALQAAGAKVELILYSGKTHTDLFLQDPLRGGKDELFDDIVSVIHAEDNDALTKDSLAPPRKRLVPELLLKLAREVSPF